MKLIALLISCLLLKLQLLFFATVTSTDVIEMYEKGDEQRQELLLWRNFTIRHKDGRVLLNLSSDGSIYSGRILGILGPSGSGKTTFLNALSGLGKEESLTQSGSGIQSKSGVKLNNENIAVIYQEDTFFSQLSVRETLFLAASLRLYRNASQNTVSEIIHYLALDHVGDNIVGDIVNRGISGGEKKRLAVGCEMLGTVQISICMYVYANVSAYAYICLRVLISICLSEYNYIYICIYIYIHIHIYIHTHIYTYLNRL
jgi:ABC-type lipoprotein export system ATPase subunit